MTSPGKGELAISEPGDPPTASRGEPGSASGKVEGIVGARRLLTINTGSSSLRAALYRLREDTTDPPEIRAEASRIGGRGGGLRLADARGEIIDERRDDLPDHIAALDALLSRLRDWGLDRDDLAAVGHRIVHGGDRHRDPQRVASEVVADLRALVPIDPNHLPQPDAPRRQTLRASEAPRTGGHHPLRLPRPLLRVRNGGAAPSRTRGGRRARRRRAPRQRGEHGRRPGRRRRRHDHGLYPDRRARDGNEERRPRPERATLFAG